MIPAQIDVEDVVDIATVDQQIEAIAIDIELTQNVATARIGQRLSEAKPLFKYSKYEGGWASWVKDRLGMSRAWADQAIAINNGLGEAKLLQLQQLSDRAQYEVATAHADVKEIIAQRVAAGEVFTAAQVKDIKQQAAAEAVERINADADSARRDLETLRSELAAKDEKSAAEVKRLQDSIADLTWKLQGYEADVEKFRKSLPKPERAKEQAAGSGGVVLGSDGKFHSGSSAEQKKMHDAFMFAFDRLLDLTEDAPSPARIAAGCPVDERAKMIERCDQAISYLNTIKDAINAK